MVVPIPPYIPSWSPVPTVTPFTYRDGITMLKKVDGIIRYLNRTIVTFINESNQELANKVQEDINNMTIVVNTAITTLESENDQKLSHMQEVVNDAITYVNTTASNLTAHVDEQVQQIINSSIELQDPVMAEIAADPNSQFAINLAASIDKGKQPWKGKTIFLYGDSISSTDYSAYGTTLAEKTGATVIRGGHSGATVAQLTNTAWLDIVANANPDLVIMMTSGNDQGVAGTVGTFVSTPSNGEPVKSDPDLSYPYAGTTFIEAAAYIARYLLTKRYLYGTKFLYLGGLPQRRSTSQINTVWNDPLNHKRKSDAVREVCERYHVPFLDTLKACGWNMDQEPFWVSPTSTTDNRGVYTMDGLHPNPDGYDRLTDAIADVANNQFRATTITQPIPLPIQTTGLSIGSITGNSVKMTWTPTPRTVDYLTEYRKAGDSDWITQPKTLGTSATISGLTAGTNYEFRVTAGNPTGNGPASVIVTATTISPVTVSDNFTRADNLTTMGSTPVGSLPWTPLDTSVFGIQSNRGYRVTMAGDNENAVVVDNFGSNIDLSLTIGVKGLGGAGPVFRATDSGNYWLVDGNATGYKLYKRVNNGFNVMGLISNTASAAGDVIHIVANGSTISASVNSGTPVTVTDAFNVSATKHGFRISGSSATSTGISAFSIA